MTCSEFQNGFSDYFDGTGEPPFLDAAAAHLRACADCRRYHDVVTAGRRLLEGVAPVVVSEDFLSRLQHRIHHLEDGPALDQAEAGSAVAVSTAVAIAALIALAAWSPALVRTPRVELSPIVVSRPVESERAYAAVPGVRAPQLWTSVSASFTVSFRPSVDRRLWDDPALFTRYSPLMAPAVERVSLARRAAFD